MPAAPPITFSTFIISIAGTALVHLGEVDRPDGTHGVDLGLARQSIDVIHMLARKTRGNLDAEEQRLVDAVLAELHDKYNAKLAAEQAGA